MADYSLLWSAEILVVMNAKKNYSNMYRHRIITFLLLLCYIQALAIPKIKWEELRIEINRIKSIVGSNPQLVRSEDWNKLISVVNRHTEKYHFPNDFDNHKINLLTNKGTILINEDSFDSLYESFKRQDKIFDPPKVTEVPISNDYWTDFLYKLRNVVVETRVLEDQKDLGQGLLPQELLNQKLLRLEAYDKIVQELNSNTTKSKTGPEAIRQALDQRDDRLRKIRSSLASLFFILLIFILFFAYYVYKSRKTIRSFRSFSQKVATQLDQEPFKPFLTKHSDSQLLKDNLENQLDSIKQLLARLQEISANEKELGNTGQETTGDRHSQTYSPKVNQTPEDKTFNLEYTDQEAGGASDFSRETTKTDLNLPKKQESYSRFIYFKEPNSEGYFEHNRGAFAKSNQSLYCLTLNSIGDRATFEFVNGDSQTVSQALSYSKFKIEPVCDVTGVYSENATRITPLEDGQAQLNNGRWVVTKKAIVKFS